MKFIGKNPFKNKINRTHHSFHCVDIGANLTDDMFQGRYNNSQKHPADYAEVLNRAWAAGLQKIIITVGTLNDADEALKFARADGLLFT